MASGESRWMRRTSRSPSTGQAVRHTTSGISTEKCVNPTRASSWIVPALCLVLAAATYTPAEGSSRRAARCDGTWHVQAAPEGHHFQELVAATAMSGQQ